MNIIHDKDIVRLSKGGCKRGKVCSKCGKYKPLWAFSHDSHLKDGLRNSCKECDAKQQHEIRENMQYDTHIMYKQCSDCGQIKPIEFFGKDKTKKDGHRSYCLDCLRLRSKRYKRPKTGFRKTQISKT